MGIVRMSAAEARKHRMTPGQRARLHAMTDEEITKAALSDPDNPPLTDEELALFRKARRAQRGRPPMARADRKVRLTLRLPPEVVAFFRKSGPGWQSRIGETLANHVKRRKRA